MIMKISSTNQNRTQFKSRFKSKKKIKHLWWYILIGAFLFYISIWHASDLGILLDTISKPNSFIWNQTFTMLTYFSYNSSSKMQIFGNRKIYSNQNTYELEITENNLKPMNLNELLLKLSGNISMTSLSHNLLTFNENETTLNKPTLLNKNSVINSTTNYFSSLFGYKLDTTYPTTTNKTNLPSELNVKSSSMFKVLVWKSPSTWEQFFYNLHDPVANCLVKNCIFTNEAENLNVSDAIIIRVGHVHYNDLPTHRNTKQYWIFYDTESPYNIFAYHNINWGLENYNNYFNWTMTYRSDSTIPVPYGRTLYYSLKEQELVNKLINYAAKKTKLVVWVSSNCMSYTVYNKRDTFIQILQKYILVDIYGKCGNLSCPGHYNKSCEYIKQYKFYLAVENSNCIEYITEKVWSNSYENEVVPVVLGARKEDYIKVTPPNSFIFAEDFDSMESLAKYLLYLNTNDTAYNEFLEWRKEYKVENTSCYANGISYYLCEVCKKLNEQKLNHSETYNISEWWSPNTNCFGSQWESKLIKNIVPDNFSLGGI